MNCQMCVTTEGQRAKKVMAIFMIGFSTIVFVFVLSAMPGAISVSAANSSNPVRGKDLFEKRCGGCHSLDADKEGPRLHSVFGRKAGSISTFKYSEALKSAPVTWDHDSLDRWLTNTESVVPDNDMDFRVSNSDDRGDIIEYLRVASGK